VHHADGRANRLFPHADEQTVSLLYVLEVALDDLVGAGLEVEIRGGIDDVEVLRLLVHLGAPVAALVVVAALMGPARYTL